MATLAHDRKREATIANILAMESHARRVVYFVNTPEQQGYTLINSGNTSLLALDMYGGYTTGIGPTAGTTLALIAAPLVIGNVTVDAPVEGGDYQADMVKRLRRLADEPPAEVFDSPEEMMDWLDAHEK